MDVWSRKIVAWDIYEEQTAENAREIIKHLDHEMDTKGIWLHSDNGSPMKGATFLGTLQKLGIIPSFSRPACSNDNAYSESLFKTLKYTERYPSRFSSVEHAVKWTEKFVNWYNNEHRHSMIRYTTPSQRHSGLDIPILNRRKDTYELAKKLHPERFVQNKTRNWSHIDIVELNPEKTELKIAG